MDGEALSLRVAILSNDDVTSNLVFAPLFDADDVEVVLLAFSKTLVPKQRGGLFTHALALLRRTDARYWSYQVFVNGTLKLRESLRPGGTRIPSLRRRARERGVDVMTTGDLSGEAFVAELRRRRPDLVVIRIDQLLRQAVLDVPPHGVWCVHSSILPAHGGIAAELHGLAQGDKSVGTTVFRVSARLDAGDPLVQRAVPVPPERTLHATVVANNRVGADLLHEAVVTLARTGAVAPQLVRPAPAPSYNTWPKPDDVRRLRERGYRMIGLRGAVRYLRDLLA